MKKIYALLTALILASSLMAQAPLSFNYQAVVRDATGNIIANTQVGMRISILQGSVTGKSVCTEELTPTTNDFGLVTLAIGSLNTNDFSAIDWSAGPYFIKVEILIPGNVAFSEMGTSQLLSVPYALYAMATKTDYDIEDLIQRVQDLEDKVFTTSVVNDIDGNSYNTVKIGTQTWLAENLKTTKYRNGDAIPNVTDNTTWAGLTSGAYSDYNNTPANSDTYGRLYNYYAALDARSICPTGWHVSSDNEWKALEMYLGMSQSDADAAVWNRGTDEGDKIKEVGTTHWTSPHTGTNSSGFTALGGGFRRPTGPYDYFMYESGFLTSTEIDATHAWVHTTYSDISVIGRFNDEKTWGRSVRCVRDE